jgi:hypothetical protein
MKFPVTLLALLVLTSCEGLYRATGTVHADGSHPLDSASVKIYCGDGWWFRHATVTDSGGRYSLGGLTTPFKATYYLIFEKPGYKIDTVTVEGSKGKTFITLDHTMTKNR